MSVPKGKRRDARSKYEQKAIELYKEVCQRMESVPARYKRLLNEDIAAPMQDFYFSIIGASETKPKDRESIIRREELLCKAYGNLQSIQKPLQSFWNVCRYDERRMNYLAGLVNEELIILAKLANKGETSLIRTISWEAVGKAEFLSNMSELHRYTYQKVARAPKRYYNYVSAGIIKCVDAAWDCVLSGDWICPRTAADAQRRKGLFKEAQTELNMLQRPLYALWNVEEYSEREMDEWAGKIDLELRLLGGVLKSDAARYKDIP